MTTIHNFIVSWRFVDWGVLFQRLGRAQNSCEWYFWLHFCRHTISYALSHDNMFFVWAIAWFAVNSSKTLNYCYAQITRFIRLPQFFWYFVVRMPRKPYLKLISYIHVESIVILFDPLPNSLFGQHVRLNVNFSILHLLENVKWPFCCTCGAKLFALRRNFHRDFLSFLVLYYFLFKLVPYWCIVFSCWADYHISRMPIPDHLHVPTSVILVCPMPACTTVVTSAKEYLVDHLVPLVCKIIFYRNTSRSGTFPILQRIKPNVWISSATQSEKERMQNDKHHSQLVSFFYIGIENCLLHVCYFNYA